MESGGNVNLAKVVEWTCVWSSPWHTPIRISQRPSDSSDGAFHNSDGRSRELETLAVRDREDGEERTALLRLSPDICPPLKIKQGR